MSCAHLVACVTNADGHGEVAVRIKPSAGAAWDLPGGSLVQVLDEWTECDYNGKKGFIKTKNLPGASTSSAESMLEVRDSYKDNTETCMRRHAEQDSTVGNVVCYVPNGPSLVKLIENWVEFRWRGNLGFVKARHVKPAPGKEAASTGLASVADDEGKITPVVLRRSASKTDHKTEESAPSSSSSGVTKLEPPAKKAKLEEGSLAIKAEGSASSSSASAISTLEAPAKKAKKAETSPAKGARPKCKYGEACYQKNPEHRKKFCHPADLDWGGLDEAPPPATAAPAATTMLAPPTESETGPPLPADTPMSALPAVSVVEPIPETTSPALATAAQPTSIVPAVEVPKAAETATEASGSSRDCDCCFDSVQINQGLLCPGKGHFFCATCLSNFLTAFKTADYADQKKGKGRALCPMKDSEAAFGDGGLAAFVPQDVFDDYLQIRIKVAEKGIQEQIENEMNSKLEDLKEKLASATGAGEQLELDKHRLKIIDDIFTLKCPRCKMAFFDYDGCSAVTCGGCKCGFCSYCLEDCGKDAHQHFYKNGSKCPNERGPLFVDHAPWQAFQNKRRENLLCKYLATVPDDLRKKVADLVASDAKDLGVNMPTDLSGPALDPEAHGCIRLKLHVPHPLRGRFAKFAAGFTAKGIKLEMPEAKAKVAVQSAQEIGGGIGMMVLALKAPHKAPFTKKMIAAYLPNGHLVMVEDYWVECKNKGKVGNGFIKAKHVEGRPCPGAKLKVHDAGGHGQVLLRKEAKQDEGKNAIGKIDDGTEVEVIQYWIECSWVGPGPAATGFVQGADVPEDDVLLQGSPDECWQAAADAEKVIKVELKATLFGGSGKGKAGKGKGRGGRGRGRG